MENKIIRVNNLTKNYKDFVAVNKLELEVPEGSIFAFLGPNGAGKSTTIRMLLGLIQPSEGEAEVFGKSIRTNREEILSSVGSLVEGPAFYPHLTAYENMKIFAAVKDVDKSEIEDILKKVNLYAVKDKQAKQFSLGMKQRLGIAIALLGNPKLLILDEPTNGLDPAGMHEIRELIKSLARDEGKTIFISSHILRELELMATHCAIIQRGTLLFQGTIEELKNINASRLIIKTTDNNQASKVLKINNIKHEIKGEDIIISHKNVDVIEINKKLVISNIGVYHLAVEEQSLEDMFLNLTEEVAETC